MTRHAGVPDPHQQSLGEHSCHGHLPSTRGWVSYAEPVVPLRTVRLDIDLLGVDDAADFAAYRGIPEVAVYQSWTPD